MKAAVGLALSLGLCAVASRGLPQTPMTGADTVQRIDWNSLGVGSPIPESMPTKDSDDPVEAGFASQWVERALMPSQFDADKFALKIVSTPRSPNDMWAYDARVALRTLAHAKVPNGKNTRVFCNSIGCLCYVERDEPDPLHQSLVYEALMAGRGRQAPFGSGDAFARTIHLVHTQGIPWELTVVIKHSTDAEGRSVPAKAPLP
jgi:hypothetical protein